jgi:hypothetical protein
MKVQHALRAFTAIDRKAIRQTAENYPETTFYKTEDLITQMGIGEALVTMLNEKGAPTPLVHVMLAPPRSRMDVLTEAEIKSIVSSSKLAAKYNQVIDSESAHEILTRKLEAAAKKEEEEEEEKEETKTSKGGAKKEEGFFDNPMVKSVSRTAANMITRSLLGALGLGGRTTRRKKSSSWF